jgi:hypothetical protein
MDQRRGFGVAFDETYRVTGTLTAGTLEIDELELLPSARAGRGRRQASAQRHGHSGGADVSIEWHRIETVRRIGQRARRPNGSLGEHTDSRTSPSIIATAETPD